MASDSSACAVALDTAGRLDRELATVATYVDDVRDLLQGDGRAALLVHAVARVIVTARQLRQQVLCAAVDVDEASVEIHEPALRARMNIAIRAFYALKQSELWIPRSAFGARFRVLRDVTAYLVDQFVQIHDRWQEQRGRNQRMQADLRRVVTYTALDEAEIALQRLGRDSDLQRFLSAGAASGCESVAIACREIAWTLGVMLPARVEEQALGVVASHEERAS